MEKLGLMSPVGSISGVGPTREKQLLRLGISTVRDLIYNFPRLYENRGDTVSLSQAVLDKPSSFILTVASEPKNATTKSRLTISKFRAFDESGAIEIVYFNSPFVKEVFHTGATFRFYGKITASARSLQIVSPKYEPYVDGIPLPHFVPIYSLTQGINSKFIEKITKIAIDAAVTSVVDPLDDKIRIDNKLPTLSYALKNIHFPDSEEALKKSIRRLAFDEMLCFGIGVSMAAQYKTRGVGIRFSPCDLSPLLSLLPYELTSSQKQTVNDIYRDTVIGGKDGNVSPMARIIVGDVGCGKTVCATIAMYITARSGYQSALMAPTEILARQHFQELSKLYSALGIKTELLLGSTTLKEKRRIYKDISDGTCDVVIGTHALITDKVEFARLGLVITDEQHRFGVNQRAELKNKTELAHMLVMSATPIPRTLALTMYGDLDVSRITEMPRGRQRVDTFVVDEDYRSRLNDFLSKQVALGGQCYVVCPSIERSEEDAVQPLGFGSLVSTADIQKNLKNTEEHAEFLRQNLKNINIEVLHGKMKSTEKDEIMSRFASGEVDVLVSTTVIEVGVNVPNASLMIVENAERFGLAQLHQLRGRVGRGTRKSYCVLVEGQKSEKSTARLSVMKNTYDGYEIAEKDLMLRGPGDFFSFTDSNLRQSGGFEFKLASLCDDTELFSAAFSSAKAIILQDPDLSLPQNEKLRQTVLDYLPTGYSTIS